MRRGILLAGLALCALVSSPGGAWADECGRCLGGGLGGRVGNGMGNRVGVAIGDGDGVTNGFGGGIGRRVAGVVHWGSKRPRLHRIPVDYSQTDATWHRNHFHQQWGTPVALVVPPTVGAQTIWSRGVGGTRVVPLYSQFSKGGAGPVQPRGFAAQPMWPYSTDEFGVYNVRGPW